MINVSSAELCTPQQIRCSLSNCVVRRESGVRCRIVFSATNQVFAAEFLLSIMNQVFAAEYVSFVANQVLAVKSCCPQRSESGFGCRICVVPWEANQVFAAELWCWQRSESWFGCQICVVLSESRVRC